MDPIEPSRRNVIPIGTVIAGDAPGFGASLRARRRALGLTQDQVADVIAVNRRVVGELERGKGTVRLEIALAAARALGLDLELQPRDQGSAFV